MKNKTNPALASQQFRVIEGLLRVRVPSEATAPQIHFSHASHAGLAGDGCACPPTCPLCRDVIHRAKEGELEKRHSSEAGEGATER